jgi:hypothetical protein
MSLKNELIDRKMERAEQIETRAMDDETRTVEIAFSSEAP